MSLLKSIPYFKEHDIRQAFLARVTPDMTDEAKTALQDEFRAACKAGEAAVELEAKAVKAANLAAFLADPKAVINEIEETKPQGYSLGEMLLAREIITVTSKRFGKGDMVGKGTDFPHTNSHFIVTAVCGPHTRIDECGSSNDRYFKELMHAGVAGMLASDIASKKEKT